LATDGEHGVTKRDGAGKRTTMSMGRSIQVIGAPPLETRLR